MDFFSISLVFVKFILSGGKCNQISELKEEADDHYHRPSHNMLNKTAFQS